MVRSRNAESLDCALTASEAECLPLCGRDSGPHRVPVVRGTGAGCSEFFQRTVIRVRKVVGMEGLARGVPAILMGGFFVFVSVMMAGDRISEIRSGARSADWPAVQGEVLRSSVTRSGGSRSSGSRSSLVFDYRYEVGGTVYEGDRVSFTAIQLRRIPNAYPVGDTVAVYHDPADPNASVLEPGVAMGAAIVSLVPFLLFSAVGFVLAGWGVYIVREG